MGEIEFINFFMDYENLDNIKKKATKDSRLFYIVENGYSIKRRLQHLYQGPYHLLCYLPFP